MSIGRSAPVGAIVLGASGYVGGELLRWLAGHPRIALAAAISESGAGGRLADAFPFLGQAHGEARFAAPSSLGERVAAAKDRFSEVVGFSAAPHAASASGIVRLLEAGGDDLRIVDLSADFRHPDPTRFEAIYGVPHPAPDLLPAFHCGLPEFGTDAGRAAGRIAHPGCFATAAALAAAPFVGLAEPEAFVSAVTGSTGSGRAPKAGTHHPERHANLFSYRALRHRHAPEMEDLLRRAGERPGSDGSTDSTDSTDAADAPGGEPMKVRFVPHSGPFARGIHATVFMKPKQGADMKALESRMNDWYADAPLVRVASEAAPRLKDVVGGAGAVVGAATDGDSIAAFCVLDNLGKGAATGGVQWMNLLLGLDQDAGLSTPVPGWL